MYVELRGVGFINKGAELMLLAMVKKIRGRYPDAVFVMAPTTKKGNAPYANRAKLGFMQKAWLWRWGLPVGDLARILPRRIREMYGIVLDSEIDVVLDAAGFAYSDQWGAKDTVLFGKACRRWHRQGTKVILLPQAFGPFTSPKIKTGISNAVKNSDLVFAREQTSYDYLCSAAGSRLPNMYVAPDFTNLLQAELPEDPSEYKNRICIIPNYRMIDRTSKEAKDLYVPLMARLVSMAHENGGRPFVLVHEGEKDYNLALEIISQSQISADIVVESDPLRVKGIIGLCRATIGSRFHGLVSSLSQGVPALGTGWSHKYKILFEDYGCPESLLPVSIDEDTLAMQMRKLNSESEYDELRKVILRHGSALKDKSEKMWTMVFKELQKTGREDL